MDSRNPQPTSASVSEIDPDGKQNRTQNSGQIANIQLLIDLLKNGDFQARWDAAKAIAHHDRLALPALLTLLQQEDADSELLWFIARILGNLEHPAAINALIHLMQSTDVPEVVEMATAALAQRGTDAISALTPLLAHSSTQLFAVQALAQIHHPQVVPPLLQVAQDSPPPIRAAAIEALSHFYDPALVPIFFSALQDSASAVRQAAVIALGIQSTQYFQPEIVDRLQPLLEDINLEVCRQTAIALGRIATTTATAALLNVLQSAHAPTLLQIEAVRALARIDSLQAIEGLHHYLFNIPTPLPNKFLDVCQEIVAVLGRVESAATREASANLLINLLTTSHPATQSLKAKQSIALSLGQLGQLLALNPLIQLLADSHPSVQFHAIAALKQLAPEAAYLRLQAWATQEELAAPLRAGITVALQEWNRGL